MPPKDKLSIEERFKVIRLLRDEYRLASRPRKSEMLNHLEKLTGSDRKTIIRRLRGSCHHVVRRKNRGRGYGPEVDDALRVIWEAYGHICAERLQPNLVPMAQHLAHHGELAVGEETLAALGRISVSTVGRYLRRIGQDLPRRKRGSALQSPVGRQQVPLRRIPWDEPEPGHFEVDLVFHAGRETRGDFVLTLQMVDVKTGWSALSAVLGRSYLVMTDGFRRCEAKVPFPVLEVHPDNGGEFFTAHMLRYWQNRAHCPQLTRSRPYHKNDNRFVEQRNGDLVRAWIGKDRLDSVAQTQALNAIYDKLWLYFNFFQPVMRLKTKSYTEGKVRRTFDVAQTPFERLCQASVLSPTEQRELEQLRDHTNPAQLRVALEREVAALYKLPGCHLGRPEDVRLTLLPTSLQEVGVALGDVVI